MTCEMWYVIPDKLGGMNIVPKLQVPSSNGLGVMMFWRYFHQGILGKDNLISQWMNHTVSSRTARLHRVCLFLTRKLTQWQWVETVVFTQAVRFVYLGDKHLRIQLYIRLALLVLLWSFVLLSFIRKSIWPLTALYCSAIYCSVLRHVETSEIPGAISDPHLWSSGLYQQTAESFRKYFTQIFYAKLIFVHKIFFLRKSTQIWGDKTDLSKKK